MPASFAARDRLLDTASDLFYRRGITATGVDTVVAAAGVSKPTLYAQFGSKDGLVAAVLAGRHTVRVASLRAWVDAASPDPRARLLAVFDWLGEFYLCDGARGCAFLNAAAEAPDADDPARQAAREHKQWTRQYLADLAAEAGLACASRLGSQLQLLIDGASARMVVDGGPDDGAELAHEIAGQAREIAAIIIAAASSGTGAS